LSDEDLVLNVQSDGDVLYFEEIYDRYAGKVYQKCLSFTKDVPEAKDVTHDVMVKIYLSLNQFNHLSKLSTWIYRITYNHCVDHEKKKMKQNALEDELEWNQETTNQVEPSDSELLEINVKILYDLLNQLNPMERSLLLMKYQDGLSIKGICEVTDLGESAVKMKLKRSKEKLITLYGNR